MKVPNVDAARIVRDAAVDAMNALNEIVVALDQQLSAEERKAMRLALARTFDAVLVNLVNPVHREYPELEADEDRWEEIGLAHAKRRCARHLP